MKLQQIVLMACLLCIGNVWGRSAAQCKKDNFCEGYEVLCHAGCNFNADGFRDPFLEGKPKYRAYIKEVKKREADEAERRAKEEQDRRLREKAKPNIAS